MSKQKTEVTDAPVVEVPVDEPWVSPQTRAEQELGRTTALANAKQQAAVEAQREKDEAEKKELEAEKEAVTKAAVYPHAADGQVKP